MNELILHHYPISPFSEKVRLVLARKKLAWKSVIVPKIMPKPDVQALTGGYRKTPFLQIGADIYCDTALICDVLERIQPAPTLFPAHTKGLARVLAQWADTTLFQAAVAYSFSPKGAAQFFQGDPPDFPKAFAEDRSKMRLGAPRMASGDAAAAYKSYLRRLANMLEHQPYLLCAEPCLADFAVYHPLWFTRVCTSAMAGILQHTPLVTKWMDRMAAIGNSCTAELGSADAIAVAARSAPVALHDEVFQDEHSVPLGSRVSIASESFGQEPTQGELLAATRMHYSLRRVDGRAGTLHVHFPRIGFALRALA